MRRSGKPARRMETLHAIVPAPIHGIDPTSEELPWQRAEDAGEVVEAFAVSGGRPYFRTANEWANLTDNERLSGVQLCSSVYVPTGYVGFIKGVQCAPYLGDLFAAGAANQILSAFEGIWETPMAWEAMSVLGDKGLERPSWSWHLRVIAGTLADAQSNPTINGFLVPNVPMPSSVYGGAAQLRLPGRAAGKRWSENRMQRFGKTAADDQVHVIVPEDTTILVFAVWTQPIFFVESGGEPIPAYALGPSSAALVGAMQRNARPAGQKSAREGWR
jgi:hypothetical protein